ncbi:purine permease 1 isoform X1 [Elaeis guineensis]|uniref:Probable purine permease n=1 Tax=Elaeis guineensis var. tenera TaxID=51953 RepID=A0A8N4F461_ELAGV|nr:purine permease 1-like isoform X1 [Elaeis guineensis]
MEVESQQQQQQPPTKNQISKHLRWFLMALNFTIMVIGTAVGPLLLRLYFLKGGTRKWLSSWLQTGGWPLLFIPLAISYAHRCRCGGGRPIKLYLMTPPLFLACTVLGLLVGLDDFLYAYGLSYLPVSTSSILISSQLGFTALFAFFMVKQKFTSFSVNAVVLLSIGAVILGLHASGDRPKGESNTQYYLGFFMTLAAAVLYGFILPLVELTYAKAKQVVSYTLVIEMQLAMGFFATVFCTVGMLVNGDFHNILVHCRLSREKPASLSWARQRTTCCSSGPPSSGSSSSWGRWVPSSTAPPCSPGSSWPSLSPFRRSSPSSSSTSPSAQRRVWRSRWRSGALPPTFTASSSRARKKTQWWTPDLRLPGIIKTCFVFFLSNLIRGWIRRSSCEVCGEYRRLELMPSDIVL